MSRLACALLVGGAVLAVTAPPAGATASRAEYAAQVNPICAATNAEAERLIEEFTDKEALNNKSKKKVGFGQFDKLFNRLSDRLTDLYDAALAQVQTIAAAPGDEVLVGTWLGNWRQIQALTARANKLSKKLNRVFNRSFKGVKSFKAFARLGRLEKRLQRKQDRIYKELYELEELDVELGTQLGVTYCVTGASGPPA